MRLLMRAMRCAVPLSPIVLLAAPVLAQPCVGVSGPGKQRVVVEVTGVRDARGEIAVTVYPDDKSRFLVRGGKLARARVAAVAGTTVTCFWLPPGGYPIAVYHDANGDHDFNRTFFVPREGYGVSNDVSVAFGRPSFDKARVVVGPGNAVVRIRLRYP